MNVFRQAIDRAKRGVQRAQTLWQFIELQVDTGLRAGVRFIGRKLHFVAVAWRVVAKKLNKLGKKIVAISPPWLRRVGSIVKRPFVAIGRRIRSLLKRRPHRSFRLTRRRDYKRSLKLPGYWSFTNSVRAMLWHHKWLFGGLMAVYFVVALAIEGFGQQDAYTELSDTLSSSSSDILTGAWGKVGQAGLLLFTSVTTGLTPDMTDVQKLLLGVTIFLAWLATVWALRNTIAGRKVTVREAIYSSGSPIVSTIIVAFILTLQLLPIAIAVLLHSSALDSGLVSGGVEEMTLWMVLLLLAVWSCYWITSTIIALVVVTLPGMYPMQAIRASGDLIIGRRLRVLFRLVWLVLITIVTWLVIMIPLILLDAWVKKAWTASSWVPVIPLAILLMSSISIVWLATYIYMLYRKVVDDDASPA